MDFELLDELIDGVGALLQGGKLLSCCCLSIQIREHEVDLGFELVHHHWCPRGVEDLLDLVCCPCPSGVSAQRGALSTPTVCTMDREKEGGQDSLLAIVGLLSSLTSS